MPRGMGHGLLFGTTSVHGPHPCVGGRLLVWARVVALPTRGRLLPPGTALPVPTPSSVPVTWASSHLMCPSLTSGPSSLTAASPLPPSLWDKVVAGMTPTLVRSSSFLALTHVTLLATHTPSGPPRQ